MVCDGRIIFDDFEKHKEEGKWRKNLKE